MKKIIFFLATCTLVSCDFDKYPDIILEYNMEDMYDLAKWELYKLNVTFDKDFGHPHGEPQKTVKLISCDLQLSSLTPTVLKDTVSMYFNFFSNGKHVSKVSEYKFHTVRFIKGEPMELELNDVAVTDFIPVSEAKESEFIVYLKNNKKQLNPWLKRAAIKKGYDL